MNQEDCLSKEIINAAIEVHRHLGPGLLESAYEQCLYSELLERGLKTDRQLALPIVYKGKQVDCAYRLDLVVENKVIIELKAVNKLEHLHHAQVLTYLKLSGYRLGLLFNFNTQILKHGIKRIVMNL